MMTRREMQEAAVILYPRHYGKPPEKPKNWWYPLPRTTLKRGPLTADCFVDPNGRLVRKEERYAGTSVAYEYTYDAKGHLLYVERAGWPSEHYEYNERGQRISQGRYFRDFGGDGGEDLHYDQAGRLIRAGYISYSYDERGALAEKYGTYERTRYFYGRDTMPDKVILPQDGVELCYAYDAARPTAPVRRFRKGEVVTDLLWASAFCLETYRDYRLGLEYRFAYDEVGTLSRIIITACKQEGDQAVADGSFWTTLAREKQQETLHACLRQYGGSLELFCGCDQVGTPKVFTDRRGNVVKERHLDSFGVPVSETFQELFIPIGFAGGLLDPDTNLVRFGHRDYDPHTGRFTAPDPLGDTGGDHDLYDYCVDDPIGLRDPDGLMPWPVLFLIGKALGLGIGAAGTYLAAKSVDAMGSIHKGERTTAATDGVNKVMPYVAGASALSTAPALVAAPAALTHAGRIAGAAVQGSKYGEKIVKGAAHAAEVVDGFFMSVSPMTTTARTAVGTGAKILYDTSKETDSERKKRMARALANMRQTEADR